MPLDDALVIDVLNACDLTAEACADMSLDDFGRDLIRQAAVLYQITIIGEAVGRMSDELKSRHPDIPWRRVRDMRNFVVHQYHDVDLDLLWEVVQVHMPVLRDAMAIEHG